MFHMLATALISLLKVSFMWAATIFVVVPWAISQEHLIHWLGIIMLGGGSIVVSAVFTVKIAKRYWRSFFPGRTA